MRRLPTLALTAVFCLPSKALGQAYRLTFPEPRGTELVAVYLTSSTCFGCRDPQMPATLDSIKVQLQRQAQALGAHFRAVFVSMDWEPDSGLALAHLDGPWDELIVGRNWLNAGAERYIWGDTLTTPAMPQMLVFSQSIRMDGRVTFGERTVLRRVLGLAALQAWVRQGSALPPWR